jgi:hypothetical protein
MEISQVNLKYPVSNLGHRKERGQGIKNTPPKSSRFESYIVNTGDLMKDVKEGGE